MGLKSWNFLSFGQEFNDVFVDLICYCSMLPFVGEEKNSFAKRCWQL